MKGFKKVIEIILIIIVIFCFGKVGLKYLEYYKAESTYSEISENVKKIEDNSGDRKKALKDKYMALKDINKDYYGWIKVDGTNIDYPIVKSHDNQEYLNQDFNGKKNSSGSIFLDYRTSEHDFNKIIHGHHMRNGTMFHNLVKFKEKDFFEKNKNINLSFKDKEETYEIFSVYVTEASDGYMEFGYDEDYLGEIKAKSLFKRDVKITSDDEILTLSTCTYEFEDARMVVHAKKIK